MRDKMLYAQDFHDMIAEMHVPINTAYNWSSGRSRPGSEYLAVYALFLRDTSAGGSPLIEASVDDTLELR